MAIPSEALGSYCVTLCISEVLAMVVLVCPSVMLMCCIKTGKDIISYFY